MSSKLQYEKVMMYRVHPSYGSKNLKIVKLPCVRRGKTLFVPMNRFPRYGRPRLFETPEAAIEARINESKEEVGHQAKYLRDMDAEMAALKKLIKG